MEVSSSERGGVLVLSAVGRVDHNTAEAFEKAVLPAVDAAAEGSKGLVLDLGGVDYMSSVGLRVLMLAAKAGKAKSVTVALAAVQPTLREILQISRFDKLFPIHATVDAAVAGGG